MHALTSKVPACQYNQVLEVFRPLGYYRLVHKINAKVDGSSHSPESKSDPGVSPHVLPFQLL